MLSPVVFAFFGYFLILLAIGLYFGQKQTSTTDFFVGNRSLNFWLTALNAHASDMSAWIFMAFPAAFYMGGAPKSWIALGLILGMFLNWQFVAQKLRLETERYGTCTLSTYFEKRFQDNSGILRIVTSLVSVFFLTAYLSAGMIAMGHLFYSIFEVNYYLGLGVATLSVIIYIFYGGFATVAWTDFFQGIFLLFMIILVPIVALYQIDSWHAIEVAAQNRNLSLEIIPDFSIDSFLNILFLASWGLGYLGQPHIITKFMGIKNADEIYKSKYLGMTWQIIALGAAGLAGLASIAYFPEELEHPESVFVELVKQLFTPGFGGVILCAIIAANISTMGSQILVCASSLSEDFYKYAFKKEVHPSQQLKVSRFSAVLVGCFSLFLAFNQSNTIMGVVKYAWDGLGSSFGPLVLLSLYSTQVNRYGAIAGVTVGGALAASWPILNPYLISFPVTSMIPAFLCSISTIYIVSIATNKTLQTTPHQSVGPQ